jgi:hypothetical protein
MPNNLFVSYDLDSPGQNYQRMVDAIARLGTCARVNFSVWYVKSDLGSDAAVSHLRMVADANDRILVVNATGNTAHWYNAMPPSGDVMQRLFPQ